MVLNLGAEGGGWWSHDMALRRRRANGLKNQSQNFPLVTAIQGVGKSMRLEQGSLYSLVVDLLSKAPQNQIRSQEIFLDGTTF